MIVLTKTYRTAGGREVRVYATDGGGTYPVHGSVQTISGVWYSTTWTADGRVLLDRQHDDDLVEVKTRIKKELWINVYPHGGIGCFYERSEAEFNALPSRIACVRVVIDCEEGEGL